MGAGRRVARRYRFNVLAAPLATALERIFRCRYPLLWNDQPLTSVHKGKGAVAESLLPRVEPVVDGLELADSMWLRLGSAGSVAAGARPLDICAAYLPDSSKPKAEVDRAYAQLGADMRAAQGRGAEIVLLGDLNARVGCASGPGERIGQFGEAAVNAGGQALLALLDSCNMFALNSRTPGLEPFHTLQDRRRRSRGAVGAGLHYRRCPALCHPVRPLLSLSL